MRWLLSGNITPAAVDAIKRHGHEAKALADVGLAPEAAAPDILEAARAGQFDLMTADAHLAHSPFEAPSRFSRTLVLLNVDTGDVEQDDAVDRLFKRYKRLSPGRLYTVTGSRVKIRQLPTKH